MNTVRFPPGCKLTAGILFASLMLPIAYAAEYEVTDFGDQVPQAEAIIEALDPGNGGKKPRGITPGALLSSAEPAAASFSSIQFAFNSFALTPRAKETLAVIGEALRSPRLSGSTFTIEGHTDSVGSEAYNQRLSEQRAAAAKQYLIEQGIDGSRLRAVGRGESELKNPACPDCAENRRVQIVRIE